jgi:hypothetical protein
MECIGPILIAMVAIAQVVVQVRKAQEAARRRALGPGPPPRPRTAPPPAERRLAPPWEAAEEADADLEEEPAPVEVQVNAPRWKAPPPRPDPREELPAIGPPAARATRRRRVLRLDRRRLKDAVVLMEILGPPVALR